jgi:hypothetical protein
MTSSSLQNVPPSTGIDSHIGGSPSLRIAPSTAGQESLIEASRSLRTAPSTAGQDSLIEASRSLGSAPSRQHSLHNVPATTTSTAIAERFSTTTFNFRAFAKQMDLVIQSNSAAKVIPSSEAIAEEVLRQQHHNAIEARIEEHGTGVSRQQWKDHRNESDMIRDA